MNHPSALFKTALQHNGIRFEWICILTNEKLDHVEMKLSLFKMKTWQIWWGVETSRSSKTWCREQHCCCFHTFCCWILTATSLKGEKGKPFLGPLPPKQLIIKIFLETNNELKMSKFEIQTSAENIFNYCCICQIGRNMFEWSFYQESDVPVSRHWNSKLPQFWNP